MKVKRHKDTITIEVTGPECAEWLGQQLDDEIMERLDAGELIVGRTFRRDCRISLVVDLEIEDPYRLSDADLDRRENGVPLV